MPVEWGGNLRADPGHKYQWIYELLSLHSGELDDVVGKTDVRASLLPPQKQLIGQICLDGPYPKQLLPYFYCPKQ